MFVAVRLMEQVSIISTWTIQPDITPFQGSRIYLFITQGVALGWLRLPFQRVDPTERFCD